LELTAARYGQILGFTESSFVAPSPFWVSFASVALGAVQLSRTVATAAQIRQVPSDNVMMIISQRGSTSVESRNNEIVSRRGDVAIVPPFDVNLYQSMDLAEDFVISTDLGSIARHVVMQGNDRQVRSALSKPLGFDLTSAVGAQCYRAIQFAWSQLTDPAMPEPTPVLEAAYEELLLSALSTLLLPALREDVQADRQDLGSDLVRRACELIRPRRRSDQDRRHCCSARGEHPPSPGWLSSPSWDNPAAVFERLPIGARSQHVASRAPRGNSDCDRSRMRIRQSRRICQPISPTFRREALRDVPQGGGVGNRQQRVGLSEEHGSPPTA
jgi:AraC-binding-like domain